MGWGAALGSALGGIAGGLLGGDEAEVKYSPGQIAAGKLMQEIGNGELTYIRPGEITQEAFKAGDNINMDISPALQYTQRVLSGDFMAGEMSMLMLSPALKASCVISPGRT